MKNFCLKYRNYLSSGVFILLALPVSYFSGQFLLENIQLKADQIQAKIIDAELSKQKIEKIPQMEKTAAEFEGNKDATETIFDADASVKLIEYLEKLADGTDNVITIQMLEKKKEVKPKTVPNLSQEEADAIKQSAPPKSLEEKLTYKNYISMQINLVGDYAAFLQFLHKLENSNNYINILSLTARKEVEDSSGSAQNQKLKVGDIFQISPDSGKVTLPVEKKVLKSSLVVAVYTE